MNKKGFTLLELLLCVAVLAIVAAIAAPTFSQGATDAMMEARKANFMSAYQNAITGTNLMIAIQVAQGKLAGDDQSGESYTRTGYLEDRDIDGLKIDKKDKYGNKGKGLMYYCPLSTRIFRDINNNYFGWTAIMTDNGKTVNEGAVAIVLIPAVKDNKGNYKLSVEGSSSSSNFFKYGVRITQDMNATKALDDIWNKGKVKAYYDAHKKI